MEEVAAKVLACDRCTDLIKALAATVLAQANKDRYRRGGRTDREGLGKKA